MKRIIMDRRLTPEEIEEYRRLRAQVEEDLPDLIEQFHETARAANRASIPSVSMKYASDGRSTRSNNMGMRPMQERVWQMRGEKYLLIKSPPASGKSRALMFVALHKLHVEKLKQAIIVVPERSIGASFHSERLSEHGFFADWVVKPRWNLCDAPGGDGNGKVDSLKRFLSSDDKALVCTHATFRFAMDRFGAESFDERLIAVDEFHHVSSNPDNKLGDHVHQLIERGKTDIVAMTGSYFRGDAEAVLHADDEEKFVTVTYTYYEQLNGYQYLKQLDIGYFFYSGKYTDAIDKVLDPTLKTIVHIPHPAARESLKDKLKEVEHILGALGQWIGTNEETGFHIVKRSDGSVLRVADLVDPEHQARIQASLRSPKIKTDRDYVDVIIALGMAKEGFDWIWCEHALTIGYRSSLTEIVQIIGRATRDAPGKTRTRFTNLIAEPDATEQAVTEAVNDTLKAIAASLLMEQVLTPRFEFRPKNPANLATDGFDYGPNGYEANGTNVGVNRETGTIELEIKGLAEPKSLEATRICREDLNELITSFVQDKPAIEGGMFDKEMPVEELTQLRMGKIVKAKFPNLDADDQEAVRQHAVAALNIVQQAKKALSETSADAESSNTAFVDGVRRFMSVRELDIDLIDRINPFEEAYAILAKTMNPERLKAVEEAIAARNLKSMTLEDARELARRAVKFKADKHRLPALTSADVWEKRMAEGIAFLQRHAQQG